MQAAWWKVAIFYLSDSGKTCTLWGFNVLCCCTRKSECLLEEHRGFLSWSSGRVHHRWLTASTGERLLWITHIGCHGTTPVCLESTEDEFVETKKCLVVKGILGLGEWKDIWKKLQSSSHRRNKFWGSMDSMVTIAKNTVYTWMLLKE